MMWTKRAAQGFAATLLMGALTACGASVLSPAALVLHNGSSRVIDVGGAPKDVISHAAAFGLNLQQPGESSATPVRPASSKVLWSESSAPLSARWVKVADGTPFLLTPQPVQGPREPYHAHWLRWYRSYNGRGTALTPDAVVSFEPRGVRAAGPPAYVVRDRPGPPKHPHRLQVLVYNAFFLDGLFATDIDRRGPALVDYLKAGHATLGAWDVLVLPELFHDDVRASVVTGLQALYPFAATVLGGDRVRIGNGGVLVLSRWPILEEDEVIFDDCTDYDCGAAKGGRYVRVAKGDRTFHLVATHMQSRSWPRAQRIRRGQVRQLNDLANAQGIGPDEPLIFAGDFNIDALAPHGGPGPGHLQMLEVLDAEAAVASPTTRCRYTYDPTTNRTALGSYGAGWRDQVLVSRHTAAPRMTVALEFPVATQEPHATFRRLAQCDSKREGGLDLSDHYALTVRLDFPPGNDK